MNFWKYPFCSGHTKELCADIPNIAKKDFSVQIQYSLNREHFRNVFKAKETPWHKPALRELEAQHWWLCHSDRRIWCWKEARVAFLSKEVLGMESVYGSECTKQPRCLQSFVFWRLFNGHSALFVWTSPVLLFPTCSNKAWSCPICCLLKGEYVWNAFKEMECPCTKPGLPGHERPLWILSPNYRRYQVVAKARVDFQSKVTMRLGCIQRYDDRVESGSSQTLVCGVLEIAILHRLFELAQCCFPLLWKRRNSPAKAGLSSKEIKFGVLSWDWNIMHRTSAQRSRDNIWFISQNMYRNLGGGGGRQGLLCWA